MSCFDLLWRIRTYHRVSYAGHKPPLSSARTHHAHL